MQTRHATNDMRQSHQLELGWPKFMKRNPAPSPQHPVAQPAPVPAAVPVAVVVPEASDAAPPVAHAVETSGPDVPVASPVQDTAEPAVPVAVAVPPTKGPVSAWKSWFAPKQAQKGSVETNYRLLTRSYANAREYICRPTDKKKAGVFSARYGILFSEDIMRYFMDYQTTSDPAGHIESMSVWVCRDETVSGIKINKEGHPHNLLTRWNHRLLTHPEIQQIQWIFDPNAYFSRSKMILQMHMCPYLVDPGSEYFV